MVPIKIRPIEIKDAEAFSYVRITSWKQTYKDIIPPALLDMLDIDKDVEELKKALIDSGNVKKLRYVAELNDKIVGIGSCGSASGMDSSYGKIYAIYLLDEVKHIGIGKALMIRMAEDLANRGYRALVLQVLKDNLNARRFYEALGGSIMSEGMFQYKGFYLPEVIYEWKHIDNLLQNRK
jgi:ribosomal protein S18 acetylase RimI-like enzyme